jgi:enterochelin esterase family protein
MRRGTVVVEEFESAALRGNAAGDPHVRRVPVYLPPAYADAPGRRFPVLFVLAGFTGRGRMLLNDGPWSPSLDDRLDALIDAGACGQMIVVLPDCLTRYGGSQYLDSSATGAYATHVVRELVPHVDARFRTLAGRGHRGVAGKSSGGYGALRLAMKHPDVFGALACHSGDMAFDYCYRGDVPRFASVVHAAGGLAAWLERFEAARHKGKDDVTALNVLGMAACYSPNPATLPFGIDLPIDLDTAEWRDDVWRRWLEHDPLTLVERHAEALRAMALVFLDCGTRDEWHLHLGLRRFTRRLRELGVPHEHQEYDDGHMNVGYRWDVSLPRLARAIGATA